MRVVVWAPRTAEQEIRRLGHTPVDSLDELRCRPTPHVLVPAAAPVARSGPAERA